ncbi:hypothetical protein DDP54_09960 [Cellulomonas sp. WB94]|nr:hypothetical protein DDP54_09960 [Cellulomonas sp. WB94]
MVEERAQQKAALDAYVEAERATIPAIKESSPGVYSDISVQAVYPSTIDYHYVYVQQVDPTAANDYFESSMETLQALCDTKVFPAMASVGVTDPQKATYTFDNADGSELWSHTFESS